MSQLEIHTLNARTNLLLPFVHALSGGDGRVVNRTIVEAARNLSSALSTAGIEYSEFGPALTPRKNRSEVALIFEIEAVGSSSYGYVIHDRVLALLGKKESHSVLAGALFGDQRRLAYLLKLHMVAVREYEIAEVGTQLFCVYVTNCSEAAVRRFSERLQDFPAFIGVCDLTFSSEFRSYLSLCVLPRYVQHGSRTIQAKGDEEPLLSAENTAAFNFEKCGFSITSVQSTYFDLLLGFKIERPPASFDEPDQLFALNALTSTPVGLQDCAIEIDDAKFKYLQEMKEGSLLALGLRDHPKSKLERAIRDKIHSTYLYRLKFVEEYRFSGFSVLLELDPIDSDQPLRVTAGFGYDESKRTARLVTLF